jgi:hypothetical protein
MPCFLVGHKSDLKNEFEEYLRAQVPKDEVTNFTEENGFKYYFECSRHLCGTASSIFNKIIFSKN